MKVLYLFSYSKNLPGVNAKIISKINTLKNLGVDIKVLCFSDEQNIKELEGLEVIYAAPVTKKKMPRIFNLKYLNFINQIVQNKRENNHLRGILNSIDFDLVIARYGMANFHSCRLTKYFKNKFVFEHNTIELDQYKLKYKNPFVSHSWITYEYFSEKIFGPKQLKNSAGIIGVTKEITNYEINRLSSKNKLPISTTISNGINVSKYDLNIPKIDTEVLNLVMILGVNAPWHGLDRIVNGLKNYNGEGKIHLYVIGNVDKIDCDKVSYLGRMSSQEINTFFNQSSIHIGIASLALHRKNIKEASVLKAREYLARGLPFILAYNDTDLMSQEAIKPFILQFESEEKEINVESILKFFNQVKQIDNYPQKIQNFALEHVDMNVKMENYKNFLNEIFLIKVQTSLC